MFSFRGKNRKKLERIFIRNETLQSPRDENPTDNIENPTLRSHNAIDNKKLNRK